MSDQDTGKFREVSGSGHVETITAEDGRIEFVIEEGAASSQAGSTTGGHAVIARTGPVEAVELSPASPGVWERVQAMPRWAMAVPVALLALALALALGRGDGGEGRAEDESAGGFRPYGGGPVDGAGRGDKARAATRAPAAPALVEEAEEVIEDEPMEQPSAVRAAVPEVAPAEAPMPIVPNNAFKTQELNTMNPGLTDEQRKLLQSANPPQAQPPQLPDQLDEPVEVEHPVDVQNEQPAEEVPDETELQPEESGRLRLPNGGYQEPMDDRAPDTIAPPVVDDPIYYQPSAVAP
jgi:hypothetical protein